MFKEKSRLIEFIKPKLKYVIINNFGKVIYEKSFFALIKEKKAVSFRRQADKRGMVQR
jgi:alpha-N-acetylglucosaminidase